MQWITTYFLENLEFKSHIENGFEKTTVKTTDLTATTSTSTPYSALKMGRNCETTLEKFREIEFQEDFFQQKKQEKIIRFHEKKSSK